MTVGIIGVGLLGGSIGYILKKNKWADKVIGIGRSKEKLEKAVKYHAVDQYIVEYSERMSQIDLLIISVPVTLIPKILKLALPYLKKGTIITDVGSTKKFITEQIESFLPEDFYFVGGHPMAGSEKTGIDAIDPYIFENAIYVLTTTEKTDKNALNTVKSMVTSLDAAPLVMNCDDHDTAVSAISHTPHIVAASLVNSTVEIDSDTNHILSLAAGGFRDTTRIASGDPKMWLDICMTNKDKIIDTITVFEHSINKFKNALLSGNEDKIVELFNRAKKSRDKLPRNRKGILSPMIEFVIFVPDQPGIIGKIANILGESGINIKDIEVLHVRENEGGSIRIGVEVSKAAENVKKVLEENNYEYKILE